MLGSVKNELRKIHVKHRVRPKQLQKMCALFQTILECSMCKVNMFMHEHIQVVQEPTNRHSPKDIRHTQETYKRHKGQRHGHTQLMGF